MWKPRLILIGVTFFLTIFFILIGIDYIPAGILVLSIVMLAYLFISIRRQQARVNLLMKDCDPQAFLERTIMQEQITGNNKQYQTSFNLDKSAAFCYMNRYEEALDILATIDIDSKKTLRNIRNVYYLNTCATLYGLNRIEEAEDLYNKHLSDLKNPSPMVARAMKYLEGDRLFIAEEYEAAKEAFEGLLANEKATLRKEFLTLRLGQIENQIGDKDKAIRSFRSILDKNYPEEFGIRLDAIEELSDLKTQDKTK